MHATLYYILIGTLLILMALSRSVLQRLPLSTSMLYLAVGYGLGPGGLGLIALDPIKQSHFLERCTEVAVLISLFTSGLKLSPPLRDRRWHIPYRLAFGAMTLTVALIAVVGVYGLGLSWGAAILLGGILAPTDPVLASDVQVKNAADQDKLRFGLTGEAGLNDGSATPFVLLGLGLMGLHEIGPLGLQWFVRDVLWATLGGLGLGAFLGMMVGRLVLYLRSTHKEATGLDEFLGLGLIALSYGIASLCQTYGFLAVFAAGLSLRRIEREAAEEGPPPEIREIAATQSLEEIATDPRTAPAYMARAVLFFNEQLEHIAEMTIVVFIGILLSTSVTYAADYHVFLANRLSWFAPLLFIVIRPLSVWLGLVGARTYYPQKGLFGWFGIRGIGSIYYLMFAIQQGISQKLGLQLSAMTLTIVALSIVVHGISVTPLMERYSRRMKRRQQQAAPPGA